MDSAALLREQLDALNGGISHAMVTIVEADGSTPRKNGKMLVFENGDTLGTIGGGSAECLAAKDAMECIRTGENAFKIYDLSSAATNNTGKRQSVALRRPRQKSRLHRYDRQPQEDSGIV